MYETYLIGWERFQDLGALKSRKREFGGVLDGVASIGSL